MKERSPGIVVVGGLLIVGALYLALNQPMDGLTLVLCAWLGLSGLGLIAQKKAAYTLYLVGLVIASIKAGFGAYAVYGDFLSALVGAGAFLIGFGIPALFVWARSEYLQPWFPKEAENA